MEIEPDGSLCHITSSAKGIVNNVKIVKVSEDEFLNPEVLYKLVFIGEEENDSESLSEKSDEEKWEEEELFLQTNIKLSTENNERDKDVKVQEVVGESEPQNRKFPKKTFNKRFEKSNVQQNHKNYKFSGTRNFNSSGNKTKNYNRLKANTSSQDIEPWLNPPYGRDIPYLQYSSGIEPRLSNCITTENSVGLLGNSPFSSHFPQHNFCSSNQNNHFVYNQTTWRGDYPPSYQTSAQNMQISGPPVHEKYQSNLWKNKGRSKCWKRNLNRSPQGRRKDNGRFRFRK